MAGIYIHIPFCRSRCAYCDFYSTTREAEIGRYVQALCGEIEARRDELPRARINTIYLGGGTPSLLSAAQLRQILDAVYAHYDVAADAEVTVEMNPDDWPLSNSPCGGEDSLSSDNITVDNSMVCHVGLAALPHTGGAGRGANRISLGIQTFDDDLLRLIRRRHDSATAIQTVRHLQAAGIRNISIDLIYGLPGQTLSQWEHDLETAFGLGIQHLSAYALSYEAGTTLTRWRDEGRIQEVADELSVQMYQRLCQRAREAGFQHYEISNFSLPGYHSRHNSSYWTGEPYLGFGPGAHSFDGIRTRRANKTNLEEYIEREEEKRGREEEKREKEKEREDAVIRECLTDAELYDEAVMCGLRTSRGIDLDNIQRRFGQARLAYLLRMAQPHLCAGRLVSSDGFLRLSELAIMTSDDIMSDLMEVDN